MTTNSQGANLVRLQKFLADAGVASRRHAEELILEGRVLVNDRVVDELPAFVDPRRDRVIADGVPVKAQRHEYFLLHKPTGVVCTNRDPGGRRRAVDFLPPIKERLFVVGRLDADSSGLLLLTNDGELAQRVTHPRYGVAKLYRVEVKGKASSELPALMKKGVYLSDGKASASHVEVVHAAVDASVLHLVLEEGRNRQVRRMLARLGHRVKSLKRLNIGPLSIKGLPVGGCRRLTERELKELRRAVAGEPVDTGLRKRRRRPSASSAKRPPKPAEKRGPTPAKARGKSKPQTGPARRIVT